MTCNVTQRVTHPNARFERNGRWMRESGWDFALIKIDIECDVPQEWAADLPPQQGGGKSGWGGQGGGMNDGGGQIGRSNDWVTGEGKHMQVVYYHFYYFSK
jgi:hypothetical protein